ncbi:DUF6017 domain-containing protein [Oribacterium sp. HCP28S3_H8]|uniref:DUF6017 domain-containing protein n=1 Tax=Oribacterium sp. HCP28S3_H8 TaxID=3438945 RepID=UPI003F8B39B9
MPYDYFYGAAGASQYAFFRIPKLLVRGEQFHDISTDAKLLYGLMLDRLQLSIKNRWFDEDDRVYIVYTIEDIMEDLNCGNQKAVKTLGELEKKAGLIIKKRRGLGKPSIIYVLNFYSARHNKHGRTGWDDDAGTSGGQDEDHESVDSVDRDIQKFENHISEVDGIITRKCEKHMSGNVMPASFEMCESKCNKNNQNKTEISNNNLINPIVENEKLSADDWQNTKSDGSDEMAERRKYESYLWEHLGMDGLLITHKYRGEMLKEIFNIILDTITSKSRYIRCAGEDKPAEVVKAQFMKLDMSHIEYVIGSLDSNILDIRNIKAYLITTLYNAPLTIDSYYTTKVHYDMAHYIPPQTDNTEEGTS